MFAFLSGECSGSFQFQERASERKREKERERKVEFFKNTEDVGSEMSFRLMPFTSFRRSILSKYLVRCKLCVS